MPFESAAWVNMAGLERGPSPLLRTRAAHPGIAGRLQLCRDATPGHPTTLAGDGQ